NNLSPTMQSVITYGAALTAGLVILGGAIVTVSGASLIMTARFGGAGVAMNKFRAVVLGTSRSAKAARVGIMAVVAALVGLGKLQSDAIEANRVGSEQATAALLAVAEGGRS